MATIEYKPSIMNGIISQINDSLTEIDNIMANFKTIVEEADPDWEGNAKTALYEKIAEVIALIPVISEKSNSYKNFLGNLSQAYPSLDNSLILSTVSSKKPQTQPNGRGESV